VEADVYVWHYALLVVHARKENEEEYGNYRISKIEFLQVIMTMMLNKFVFVTSRPYKSSDNSMKSKRGTYVWSYTLRPNCLK